MFVTNWISTTKIQKISEITNFFRHYFLSRTEVNIWQTCQRKTCSYKTKKMVNHLLMIHHLFILMICCLKRQYMLLENIT